MKRSLKAAVAVLLAVVMAFMGPARAFADSPKKTYISDVKIGTGDSARSDLEGEGYTVLCDKDGKPIDLNQGAGGGLGSKGS